MKVAPFDDTAWRVDHPLGTVAFNYLIAGGPEKTPDNYRYILGRQDADFHMPRHRHTFDQIRLPLVGDMNLGEQRILHEGEIGYFPEGQTYGPQDDVLADYGAKPGDRLQLVLQFGGASGLGIAGAVNASRRRAQAGTGAQQRRAKFPRPRYKNVVIVDPENFNWLPIPRSAGVENKFMGSFSERGVWIEMVKIGPGATWASTDGNARRVFAVLSGAGEIDGTPVSRLSTVEADAGEELHVSVTEEMELFMTGLPPVRFPAVESGNFDYADGLGNTTQFEDPKQAV
jgi:hypothetical protein